MKKYKKFFAVLLAISMVLPGLGQVVVAAEKLDDQIGVIRLGGIDREGTAVLASQEAYKDGAKTVVLTGFSGEVDALTGTLLAGAKKGPLLITRKDKLSQITKTELKRLKAKTVYIIGGTSVVSESVETELEKAGYAVRRIQGSNRNATAAAVAKEVKDAKATHVFLALGRMAKETDALADALAIGPVSIMKNMPVLITKTNEVPAATLKAMGDLGVTHITLVGGTKAISAELETELKKDYEVDRVGGNSRENTALEIAKKYFPNAKNLIVAYGRKSADALVGGYLGALRNAPILLTNNAGLTAETKAYMQANKLHTYILGGEKVVSKQVEEEIKTLLKADIKLEVESVSAINATTILVELSNGSMHEVVLENGEVLELNKKTEVSFEIDGVYYTADVTLLKQSAEGEKEIEAARIAFKEAVNNYEEAEQDVIDAELALVQAEKYGTAQEVLDAEYNLEIAEIKANKAADEMYLAGAKLEDAINDTQYAVDYEKALKAVQKAERSNNQVDVKAARKLVKDLEKSNPEQDLRARLDYVDQVIAAIADVVYVENFIAKEDFNLNDAKANYKSAKAAVDALEDGKDKTNLLNRLEAVKAAVDADEQAKFELNAKVFTERAEAQLELDKPDFAIVLDNHGKALLNVEKIEDKDVKAAFEARLAEIAKAVAADKAISPLVPTSKKEDIDAAQALVTALKDGTAKENLQKRLDVLNEKIAAAEVDTLISKWNTADAVDEDFIAKVEAARAAYDKLDDGAKDRVSEANVTKLEAAEAKMAKKAAEKVALMFKNGNGVADYENIKVSELTHVKKAVEAFDVLDTEGKEMVEVFFGKKAEVAAFKAALKAAGL